MTRRIDPTRMSATEHLVREYFGDPAAYGMTFPLKPGFYGDASRLVLAIVGADGKVSPTERAAWEASARLWGTPEDEIRASAQLDPRAARIDALATPQIRPIAGMLLYDAMRIARTDGFHEKEREVTTKVARSLGLDAAIVPAIEALLRLEETVREARNRLLQVPAEHQGEGPRAPPSLGIAIEYGSDGAVPVSLMARIPEAIKIVAAADGDLSEPEQAWLVGQARLLGLPDTAVERTLKFDPVGKRIEDYADAQMRPYARLVVFDAIRCARVDGFHDREREIAQRAAAKLGLDPTFVVAMENQIRTEDALRDARRAVLAPRG